MISFRLKKYKLLYRANLEADVYNLTMSKHRSGVKIINSKKFLNSIADYTDSGELWSRSSDQYCDLKEEEARKQMVSPTYAITKAYYVSDDSFYDLLKKADIKTFFRTFDSVWDDILKSKAFEDAKIKTRENAEKYIDEVIDMYQKANCNLI